MTIASQVRTISANVELATKAREFAALARCVALGRGQRGNECLIAKEAGLPRVADILSCGHRLWEFDPKTVAQAKAAILAGGTASGDWSEQLASYQVLTNAFLESLRNFSAFDKMLAGGMRKVPMRARIGAVSASASGSTVPQASMKVVSRISLSNTTIDEQKCVALVVLTNELMRFGDAAAGDLFMTELSNAVSVAVDTEFVSILMAGANSFVSQGSTPVAIRADLRSLLLNVTTSARSRLYLLTTSTMLKTLSVMGDTGGAPLFPGLTHLGGQVGGLEVIVSDGVPASTMILVDATQVAAASEAIALSASDQATVQLDSAPDSPPSGSTLLTSLWQHNMTGLRAERYFAAEKLTTTGVAVCTSASYGNSP